MGSSGLSAREVRALAAAGVRAQFRQLARLPHPDKIGLSLGGATGVVLRARACRKPSLVVLD
eukprot:1915765-Lingulodinium_polyedra.AAC.1